MDGVKRETSTPGTVPKGLEEIRALPKLARQHLSRFAERLLGGSPVDLDSSFDANPLLRKKVGFLIRDYCAENARPEIRRFSGLMEMKLMKHDPARGQEWKDQDPLQVFAHVHDLMGELESAIANNQRVGLKAADVANHLMILADLFHELDAV